jgi:hypothetical protein
MTFGAVNVNDAGFEVAVYVTVGLAKKVATICDIPLLLLALTTTLNGCPGTAVMVVGEIDKVGATLGA